MNNYVLSFFIKNTDWELINKNIEKINSTGSDLNELELLDSTEEVFNKSKLFENGFKATLMIEYSVYFDELEFSVMLESPDDEYMEFDTMQDSFNKTNKFKVDENSYTVNIFEEVN